MDISETPRVDALSKEGAKNGRPVKPSPRSSKRRARSVEPKLATRLKTQAAATRKGTKTGKILGLLQRPGGATLKELCKATAWQAHSVRGFLSGALKKKMGLRIDSAKRDDGERTYRVASK
jgi:hypothetical protein